MLSMLFSVSLSTVLFVTTYSSPTFHVSLHKRMVDGDPTGVPIPWLVSIQNVDGHFCGGSLISTTTVLTAAHCFENTTASVYQKYEVFANRYNIEKSAKEKGIRMRIRNAVLHPEYSPDTLANDIAILMVEVEKREDAKQLQVVQLDDSNAGLHKLGERSLRTRTSMSLEEEAIKNTGLDPTKYQNKTEGAEHADQLQGVDQQNEMNKYLFAAGWGLEHEHSDQVSSVLRKAPMKVALHSRCQDMVGLAMDPKSVICALGANFDSDACQGDSGGPLFYQKGNITKLVGIVSYGIGCGRDHHEKGLEIQYPGVYTRTYFFLDFIQKHSVNVNIKGSINVNINIKDVKGNIKGNVIGNVKGNDNVKGKTN